MVLEDIILKHGLYVATNTYHTFHHLSSCENSQKSTIDLPLTKGIKNINIKTLDIEETSVKIRHKAIIIHVRENNIKNPEITHFRTKNAKWDQWQNFFENNLWYTMTHNELK